MDNNKFFFSGHSDALDFASRALARRGYHICTTPGPDITHLVLPIPSFDKNGNIKGDIPFDSVLDSLPKNITVIGGNLQNRLSAGYRCIDLLQDDIYLAQNASITAYCSLGYAINNLPVTLRQCPVLILGWGRIGKCLAKLLSQLGSRVSIFARKPKDVAMLKALGYESETLSLPAYNLSRYRVIFNTSPSLLLTQAHLRFCRPDCVKIDLASSPGIDGSDVIWARGLPGKDAPESSGKLIADTIARLVARKE